MTSKAHRAHAITRLKKKLYRWFLLLCGLFLTSFLINLAINFLYE